jgi:hypothetical protein
MAVGVTASSGVGGSASLADKAQSRRSRIAIFGGVVNKPVGARSRFVNQKRKRFAPPKAKPRVSPSGVSIPDPRDDGDDDE